MMADTCVYGIYLVPTLCEISNRNKHLRVTAYVDAMEIYSYNNLISSICTTTRVVLSSDSEFDNSAFCIHEISAQ